MEGRYNLVTKEEVIGFRRKYKLSTIEAEAVLYQRENSLIDFEKGRTYRLYNEEFVRKMIDNEDKFKEHVENLYKEGKIIKRIYAKVFTDEVLESKKTVDEEKYKFFNQDVAEKVLEFQKMFNISDGKLMHIFDIKKKEVELLKKGLFVDGKKAQFMTDTLESKDNIIDLLRKRVKEGKLTSSTTYSLIDEIAIYYREEKEKERVKLGKRYNKKEKKEELNELELERKVTTENNKLNKIRQEAQKEFESECKGLTEKTNKRDLFVEALYKKYSNNEKLDSDDINIIKETMLLHTNMISSYTLKIVVLGSLRTDGYETAYKNISELIRSTENQDYKVKLTKFRRKLDDEYNKMKIKEMSKEGYSKYDIIKELNLTTKDFWRLVDEGR